MNDHLDPPAWVKDAVFYQIFPDRFRRSGRVEIGARLEAWDSPPNYTGYKGGDLWGVIDKLDYLSDLGITAIYFNPLFQSASNHRYHTHDYFRIDPLLGGDEAFDVMLNEAHERGIRVVLDGVFNHASRGFFQFSDIAEHQQRSAFLDWFRVHGFPVDPYDHDSAPTYDAWWGMHALPAFNTENEAVREFLWGVAEYWIERGADGWRLDVPEEIQTPGFWEEFRRRVRAVNPEAYITGEIWSPAQSWVGDSGRFDGVMNYPLGTAIIAFAIGNRVDRTAIIDNNQYSVLPGLNAGEFADRIDWIDSLYSDPTELAMLNLLDSHDTGRIRSLAAGRADLVVLALTLLFTMPGAPCLYYGTEVGLAGGTDPDCRRGFPWDDEAEWCSTTLEATRALIALRHREPGLRSPGVERIGPVPGPDYGRTYVYGRGTGAERLVIAVNHADEPDVVPVPAAALSVDADRCFGEAEIASTASGPEIRLPARQVGIWKAPV